MARLEGKVAIVTGAGAGIGRGTALVLASEGASVTVAGRTLSKCERVADEIERVGGRALALECDVNHRDQIDDMVHRTVESFGPPDILVNNAQGGGLGGGHRLETVSDDVFLDAFRGGVLSSLYAMQAVFPYMMERTGNIVNMASSTGIMGDPGFGPYGTAKEAIRGLTKHAAREWGRYGIRVNVVAPAALGRAPAGSETRPRSAGKRSSSRSRSLAWVTRKTTSAGASWRSSPISTTSRVRPWRSTVAAASFADRCCPTCDGSRNRWRQCCMGMRATR